MDKNLKESLLQSIELSGSADREIAPITIQINKGLDNILDRANGRLRVRPVKAAQFKMILSQPLHLRSISNFEIRCLHCKKVISYPAWWLEVKFDRNIFEYFVCFSETSPGKVSLDCR